MSIFFFGNLVVKYFYFVIIWNIKKFKKKEIKVELVRWRRWIDCINVILYMKGLKEIVCYMLGSFILIL